MTIPLKNSNRAVSFNMSMYSFSTSTTAREPAEREQQAKRWMIIGAHLAGASERQNSRICGLSTTAVRQIILNWQRTGEPCLPKKIPKKVQEKAIVEYDENGDLIMISDEENSEDASDSTSGSDSAQERSTKSATGAFSVPYEPITQFEKPIRFSTRADKYNQVIKGFEAWTHEDDCVLLYYCLNHLYQRDWHSLADINFKGRHCAHMCSDRWGWIRSKLLKEITRDIPDATW